MANNSESSLSKLSTTSIVVLSLLVAIRIADNLIPNETASIWNNYYGSIAYTATLFVIWSHIHNLDELNVDSIFINLFIASSLLLYTHYFSGLLTILIAITIFLFIRKLPKIATPHIPLWIWFLTAGAILLAWLPVFIYSPIPKSGLNNANWFSLFLGTQPIWVLIEEFIFRGLLWRVLKKAGINDFFVVFIQSLFFSLSHYQYYSNQSLYFFIISILFSLIIGYSVLRSKSLIPSTIAHFLFNLSSQLILYIYV